MKKVNWKFKISFALFSGVVFSGMLYILDLLSNEIFYSMNSLIFQGIFFGIFFGLGFPLLMGKIGRGFSAKLGNEIKPDLVENEQIEVEGPANLFCGIEGVGGKLYLTSKKMIFKSHKFNIQQGQTNIDYIKINEIIKRKTAKIIDNGIRIRTIDGEEFDFVINDREEWVKRLNEKVDNATQHLKR